MANISIKEVIKWVDENNDNKEMNTVLAREALNICFTRGNEEHIIDDERINDTLYLQSRDGNVAIDFDKNGLIINIEIS